MGSRTKLDKIFDNTFGENEFEADNMGFKIDPSFENNRSAEDIMHANTLFMEIDTIIKDSKFSKYSLVEKDKKVSKLNKVQINEVFTHVIDNLNGEYRMLEVFSCISDYFDIYPKKFYTSISNKYKIILLEELETATGIFAKKNINKIF